VLSGGVFQNRLLLELTVAALEDAGLRVLLPQRLPPNDGAISYGQAAVAAARSAVE
jgi:hydrogenase maturation protein HypF